MPIRSAVLGVAHSTAAAVLLVCRCPVGSTLIVKTIGWWNSGAAAAGNSIYARSQGSYFFFAKSASLAADAFGMWQGWVALEPGDWIEANLGAAGIYVHVSGTVLSGVAPPTDVLIAQQLAAALPERLP